MRYNAIPPANLHLDKLEPGLPDEAVAVVTNAMWGWRETFIRAGQREPTPDEMLNEIVVRIDRWKRWGHV